MAEEVNVSLEAYAMVHAGLEAGVSLGRAVANASVTMSDWEDAEAVWVPRLEGKEADRAQVSAFERALRAARERYQPTWEPIASDPRAWITFRGHFIADDDPVEFLRSRGLDPAAFARLESHWTDVADGDEAAARELREAAARPLSECPAVRAVPSPWAIEPEATAPSVPPPPLVALEAPPPERPVEKPSFMLAEETASDPPATQDPPQGSGEIATPFRPSPSPPPAAPPPPVASAVPSSPPIALERYAVMFADRQLFGMSESDLATKHGLSPFDIVQATAYWSDRVAKDVQVATRVEELVNRYRAAMEKARRSSSSGSFPAVSSGQDPAPKPKRDGSSTTQPTEDLVRAVRAALPFAREKLPMPAHVYANMMASSSTTAPEKRLSTGTMFAPDAVGGAALPFDTRPVEGITMEIYAKIAAELTFKPDDRDDIFARYSIRDVEQYCVVANQWNKRVAELGLSGRYMQLFASHLDTLVKS